MRKHRQWLSIVIVLILTLSLSTSALAITYDNVDSYSKLDDAFKDESGQNVDIILTGSFDASGGLRAKDGIKYTITAKDKVKDTLNGANFNGSGTVEINANLTDTVTTHESVSVTINGNITANGKSDDGIQASDSSNVTVNGSITVKDDGVEAEDDSIVIVNGSITAKDDGVKAEHNSKVTINGKITVDDDGVEADDSSTVTVNGSITTKDDGVNADDNSNVTVMGNITARDYGVRIDNTATVTVSGNVVGGSTSGKSGVIVHFNNNGTSAGSLTVAGSVTGGVDGFDLLFESNGGDLSDYLLPSLTVGAYSSANVEDFTEAELAELLSQVVVTGIATASEDGEDHFWQGVYALICRAEPGSTITVDAADRTEIPTSVLRAAQERGVTLVIQWNGGEDILVSNFVCEEADTWITLAKLAELVKQ